MAKLLGVLPRPDPVPERNVFIRSDQYSFIRRGIPSLMVMVGFDKGSPEEQIVGKWLTERYHAPSDDVKQPADKKAAGEFDVLVAKLLERVANRESRPGWKDTSFFKRFAESASRLDVSGYSEGWAREGWVRSILQPTHYKIAR